MNNQMARLFKAAYDTIENVSGKIVEPKTITSLAFAVDKNAKFSFTDDNVVFVHFTDGSIAELIPLHAVGDANHD